MKFNRVQYQAFVAFLCLFRRHIRCPSALFKIWLL